VDFPFAETQLIFANRITYEPHSFDEHDTHLDAYGLYSMVKGLPFTLDLFWIGKHTRPDMVVNAKGDMVDLDTHTVGFYLDGKLGRGWDWGGTFAYTCGDRAATTYSTVGGKKVAATTDDDVRAWGANARFGYTFHHPWEPRLGVQATLGSGDSNPNPNGRYETFDGAFGAVDLFYGRMNLFSWMNIQDYEINFSTKPVKKAKLSADFHFFRLDEAKDAWYYSTGQAQRRDTGGNAGRNLGDELDLIATYKHSKHLEVQAGYAHFWPGDFIERTGPSPDAEWFFLQTLCSL
jgi:hypothetical protein